MKTNSTILLVAAASGVTVLASLFISTSLPGDTIIALFLSAAFVLKFLGDYVRRPFVRPLEETVSSAPSLRPAAPVFIDASMPARYTVRRRPAATTTSKVAA